MELIINLFRMKVIFFLFAIFSYVVSIPIGSNCSLGSIFCGSNPSLELLTCDPTTQTCLGSYSNNQCSSNQPCASTLFCNSGICDMCPTGCASCSSSTICITCLPGYIQIGSVCVQLLANCLVG